MEKHPPQLVTLKGNEMHKIASSNATAETVFTYLATRDRLSSATDIVRTKYYLLDLGEKLVDEDYFQVFKDLEKAGIGSYISGRHGKNDRFLWNYNLKVVGKVGVEGKDDQSILITKHTRKPRRDKKRVPKIEQKKETTISYIKSNKHVYIPIRNDFCVEFQVPSDLSKIEANLIKSTLERLVA